MRVVRNATFLMMVLAASFLVSERAKAADVESCNPPAFPNYPHVVVSLTSCDSAGSQCNDGCHECHYGNVVDVVSCEPYGGESLGYYAVCQCAPIIE